MTGRLPRREPTFSRDRGMSGFSSRLYRFGAAGPRFGDFPPGKRQRSGPVEGDLSYPFARYGALPSVQGCIQGPTGCDAENAMFTDPPRTLVTARVIP